MVILIGSLTLLEDNMDEVEKLKNAWSIDDVYVDYSTQSTPVPSGFYDNNDQFGEIAPKNERLHSFDIENSLEKIRNLQSGSITPSQAWATGLMGLVPGLLGYAVGGNEGAADGFNIGSKVVGGYTENIQKNNLQQAQAESALVRDAINEKQWQRRTDYQDKQQRERAKEYIESQKELLKWKGDEGYTRDYNDPSQGGGKGRPNLSPETNLELQDAIVKGYATPELRAKIFAEVGPYGGATIFHSTGLNIKQPEKDYADTQSSTVAGLKAIEELRGIANELGTGIVAGAGNLISGAINPTSAAGKYAARASILAKDITLALEPRATDRDMETNEKVLSPSYWTAGKETALQNLDYFENKIKARARENLKGAGASGRNVKGLEEYTDNGKFLGAVEGGLDENGVNNLETEKSLAELDGQKVVDETVDNGVVEAVKNYQTQKKRLSDFGGDGVAYKEYIKNLKRNTK